jgi:hypothetical protein
MSLTMAAAVIVTVFLTWSDINTVEDRTEIYREIAGTYQLVGEVGENQSQFSETFSASKGAQLPYKVKIYDGELFVESNEWVGTVPLPCKVKGKSGNC